MAINKDNPVRIAIIGGGIAGGCLSAGLLQYPHIEAHIYEAAKDFSERGAGVGLSANARRGLDLISPAAGKTLELAGAVEMKPDARLMMGIGPHAGEKVLDIEHEVKQVTVHRNTWINEIMDITPNDRKHTGKKLALIEEQANGIKLTFEDNSTDTVDVVIGADGIHSFVRRHMFGPGCPLSQPIFSGYYMYFHILPKEKVFEKIAKEWFETPSQYGWAGDNLFLLHDFVEHGTQIQLIAALWTDEDWPSDQWQSPPVPKDLEDKLGNHFNGAEFAKLLLSNPDLCRWSIWVLPDAPTFTKGNICIMGDAAHAFTPWQGSGAGQSIEDALILSRLLGGLSSKDEIPAALQAYDGTRRERTQEIGRSSAETGEIFCGRKEGMGLNIDKMREVLKHRWDFILNIDLHAHIEDALKKMKEDSGKTPT